jgi:hypothetical protein
MCTRKPGISALLSVLFFISFIATSLQARQVGKFSYRGDIRTLDGDTTIQVSDTMVAMSEKVRAFQDVLSDTISTPPSIFFIIDNSTSMSGTNGNDPVGNRFTVTSALIDTVMAKFPQAEVGLAVFIGGLYYNPASKPGIFQTITSASRMGLDSTGAFVPLLTLNQTYGTQTGYQILKEVLAVNNGALTYASIPNLQTGTNINSGFDAAIQAYSATNFAKENQFIIFLSDGEANRPTSSSSAFTAATNCPTTFTVYFTTGATVPTTIQTYTANCKINGYSTSNDSSNAWAYRNTTFDALMGFLMDHVLSIIIKDEIINPSTLVINSLSSTSWTIADSTFTPDQRDNPLQHPIGKCTKRYSREQFQRSDAGRTCPDLADPLRYQTLGPRHRFSDSRGSSDFRNLPHARLVPDQVHLYSGRGELQLH